MPKRQISAALIPRALDKAYYDISQKYFPARDRRTFENLSPSNVNALPPPPPTRTRNFTGDNDDVERFVVPKVSVTGAAAFVAIVNNGRTRRGTTRRQPTPSRLRAQQAYENTCA